MARNMLCGFCAKEQSFADFCIRCEKALKKGVFKGKFWQGGKGCRDKKMMSKNLKILSLL